MNGQLDMLALAAEEKKVGDGLLALALMYSNKEPDAFYWKAVLTFSYRYFNIDAINDGMQMLSLVPTAYLRGEFVEQMEVDPLFAEVGKRIADKLIEAQKVASPSVDVDRSVNVQRVLGRA